MKTNYTKKNYQTNLKALMAIAFLFCTVFISAQTLVETTVFTDDFSGGNLVGGVPTTTYTVNKVTGVGDPAADPTTTTTVDVLRIPNRKGSGYWGRNGVFGNLSAYASPFTSKLSTTDVDSIVWTFNMRQNYNFTLSGFDDAQNAVGAVLLADAADYASGNGYAVVYGEAAVGKKYRLVKFSNGIDANAKLTTIALGDVSPTDGRDYMSFRIVYIKSTNTWKMNGRFDGPNTGGAFADPGQGTFNYAVSGVNNELVDTEMTSFGFFQNYSANIDKIMWVDNYTVKTYKMDTGTSLDSNLNGKLYSIGTMSGGIQINAESAKVTLYNTNGAIVSLVNISGQANIEVKNKGLYLLKLELPGGKSVVEKVSIQ